MIEAWNDAYPAGQPKEFPVIVINDLADAWKGSLRLRILDGAKTVAEQTLPIEVAGLGSVRRAFPTVIPQQPGQYQMEATLLGTPSGDICSLRDFAVLTPEQIAARDGIAVGKPVTASSNLVQAGATCPEAAVDGSLATRWSSAFSDPQWLAIDLGSPVTVGRVELAWEPAFAKSYALQVSTDGQTWTDVYKTDAGKGGLETLRLPPVPARWIRLHGTQRATQFGYSLWEFRVFDR